MLCSSVSSTQGANFTMHFSSRSIPRLGQSAPRCDSDPKNPGYVFEPGGWRMVEHWMLFIYKFMTSL